MAIWYTENNLCSSKPFSCSNYYSQIYPNANHIVHKGNMSIYRMPYRYRNFHYKSKTISHMIAVSFHGNPCTCKYSLCTKMELNSLPGIRRKRNTIFHLYGSKMKYISINILFCLYIITLNLWSIHNTNIIMSVLCHILKSCCLCCCKGHINLKWMPPQCTITQHTKLSLIYWDIKFSTVQMKFKTLHRDKPCTPGNKLL